MSNQSFEDAMFEARTSGQLRRGYRPSGSNRSGSDRHHPRGWGQRFSAKANLEEKALEFYSSYVAMNQEPDYED